MFLRRISLLKDKITDSRQYPFSIPAIARLESIELKSNITFFVGENGSGKSTLLEAIAYQCGFNIAGGGSNNSFELEAAKAALSPTRQLSLLKVIYDLTKDNTSQFIIATHSPILLGYPEAQIINFNTSPISEITYEETDHYQITKGFLNRRELYLKELFKE